MVHGIHRKVRRKTEGEKDDKEGNNEGPSEAPGGVHVAVDSARFAEIMYVRSFPVNKLCSCVPSQIL